MKELAPFVYVRRLIVCRGDLLGIDAVGLGGTVDELENEGASSDNTGASWQTDKSTLAFNLRKESMETHESSVTHKSRPTMFSSTELLPLD